MDMALMRIQEGEQNLSGLAFDLGYASHSHFTSVFRRHFGVTPSQMRFI
jgi:AraC family transcriptional regulator